jgi:hypothetical protein
MSTRICIRICGIFLKAVPEHCHLKDCTEVQKLRISLPGSTPRLRNEPLNQMLRKTGVPLISRLYFFSGIEPIYETLKKSSV